MTLKERINSEFTEAYKAKNMFKKTALGMLKTKITEAEKKEGKELTDNDVITVVSSAVKQLDQTIESYTQNGVDGDKMAEAFNEKDILLAFLPVQLTTDEMSKIIDEIENIDPSNKNKAMGMIMNHFKQNYPGQYNPVNLKSIIDGKFA